LIKNPNAPKVIANIPETGFAEVWDDIFFRATVKKMRGDGLNRHQAKEAARLYITSWRKFGNCRMSGRSP
jgi:hypothetical protein